MLPILFRNNLFDDLMDFAFPAPRDFGNIDRKLYGKHAAHVMKTDVHENESGYEVDIDLPGFKKEEIGLSLENGYLTVSASKGLDEKEEDKRGKLIRCERFSGSMSRSFYVGKNVLVRYDNQYIISEYDYDDPSENVGRDNLDPVDWLKCYSWNTAYYATNYYSYYAGSNASDECTSGGLAFPIRFLWDGGKASIICPFSLAESTFSGYYYTFYYGDIEYLKPNY